MLCHISFCHLLIQILISGQPGYKTQIHLIARSFCRIPRTAVITGYICLGFGVCLVISPSAVGQQRCRTDCCQERCKYFSFFHGKILLFVISVFYFICFVLFLFPIPYPFTAPVAIPSTTKRWQNKKTIIRGRMADTAAAIIRE